MAARLASSFIDRVLDLAASGKTMTQIADALHATRSSIAGIIHRNKIKLVRVGDRPRKKPTGQMFLAKVAKLKLKQAASPVIDQAPSSEHNCLFGDLDALRCRYPHGRRVPYTFCGAPKDPDQSYCPYHDRLCNKPTNPIPERAARYYPW